ncbi:hypothetical protein J2R78_008638 [Bradyrhizobium sp. USDA 4538]|nr:hypothetical protein [Bradyrhizobium sp. USDA 4538]MCP1985548.1 hypothetical protein [Bradyrhizobium sp. USDA 4539]
MRSLTDRIGRWKDAVIYRASFANEAKPLELGFRNESCDLGHFRSPLGAASLKALPEQVLWQVAPDENEPCLARLLVLPGTPTSAFNEHVHALNDKLPIVILDRCDALHAKDVRTKALCDILNPGHEPAGLHRSIGDQGQAADPVVVFVLVFFGEESGLDFEDALEIEGVLPQYLGEIDTTALRSVNLRIWVDVSDTTFDYCEPVRIEKINLVDENDVGERELLLRFWCAVDLFEEMPGVRDSDDGVELRLAADVLVDKERLRHRRRICEPCRLDDNAVEGSAAPHQPCDDPDEVTAHRAADAAVVHLENLLVRVDDEIVVDTDLSEFVHDHRKPPAVRLGEDAVQKRRLAGAEIAGQNRDGNPRCSIGHGLLCPCSCHMQRYNITSNQGGCKAKMCGQPPSDAGGSGLKHKKEKKTVRVSMN